MPNRRDTVLADVNDWVSDDKFNSSRKAIMQKDTPNNTQRKYTLQPRSDSQYLQKGQS